MSDSTNEWTKRGEQFLAINQIDVTKFFQGPPAGHKDACHEPVENKNDIPDGVDDYPVALLYRISKNEYVTAPHDIRVVLNSIVNVIETTKASLESLATRDHKEILLWHSTLTIVGHNMPIGALSYLTIALDALEDILGITREHE